MNKHIERFVEYLKTSVLLLEQASKEEIANTARVLALHLGHYRTRYGDLPTTEPLHLLTTETLTDEMAVTLVSSVEASVEEHGYSMCTRRTGPRRVIQGV